MARRLHMLGAMRTESGHGGEDADTLRAPEVELTCALTKILEASAGRLPQGALSARGLVLDLSSGDAEALRELLDVLVSIGAHEDEVLRVSSAFRDITSSRATSLRPVDLRDVVDAASALVAPSLRGRAMVRREYERVPRVLADDRGLVDVVQRLLIAAADVIDVRESPAELRVRVSEDCTGVRVLVESPRVSSASERQRPCRQLDVLVCRHLVRLHGGELAYLDGEQEITATFSIPVTNERAVSRDAPTTRPRGSTEPRA